MKTIEVEDKTVKLQLWDTAGTEKYRSITTSYYRGAHCAFIVFDLTSEESFNSLQDWIKNYYKYANKDFEKNIIIIGNKNDLTDKRKVTPEQIDEFIKLNKLIYFETSAKTGENVDESFEYIAKKLLEEQRYKEKSGIKREVNSNTNLNLGESESISTKKSKCCF